jgi:hypothetical protein
MRDGNNSLESQRINDCLQVAELLPEAVGRAGWLIGRTEPQEIECINPSPGGDEIRDQLVLDMLIVRESVHQYESRGSSSIIPCVYIALTLRNSMLSECWRLFDSATGGD